MWLGGPRLRSDASSARVMPALGPASTIPFIDLGGHGGPLVFLHGNGFPPGCYSPLLGLFSTRFHVQAMFLRPLWQGAQPEEVGDWHILSRDLLHFLDQEKMPAVIAVGHSMGAIAALRAALWAPQRFTALVLLEPVLLPRSIMLEWRVVRTLGLGYRVHPLISGALRRQREFASSEIAFERYRPRPIFRFFSDDALRTYIAGMTIAEPDGRLRLAYSPEWEARLYDTGVWNDWDLWRGMNSLAVPTLIVRGAESDTLRESTARAAQHLNGRIRIALVQRATHLLPLERPQETFQVIESFLEQAAPTQGRALSRQMREKHANT